MSKCGPLSRSDCIRFTSFYPSDWGIPGMKHVSTYVPTDEPGAKVHISANQLGARKKISEYIPGNMNHYIPSWSLP